VVLPFVNRTSRRGAGDTVALELARQLAAIPGIEVLEPGMVRADLLRLRLVMMEGPSLDDVFALGAILRPDFVVSGQVLEYEERGEPRLSFSVAVIERESRRLVWRSNSYARGDEGVWFFGAGRVSTPLGLACEMSRGVVERFVGER
jgi:TolB-like protein